MDEPRSYTCRTYFSNIFVPPTLQSSAFLNFGPMLSSKDQNLHYMTKMLKPEDLKSGSYSIRPLPLLGVTTFLNDPLEKMVRKNKMKSREKKLTKVAE